MTITANQRSVALTQILAAAIAASGQGPVIPLSQLLPGVSPSQVLNTLLAALGSSVDSTLTTALSNMVTAANATITTLDGEVATQQANVTAWTVV